MLFDGRHRRVLLVREESDKLIGSQVLRAIDIDRAVQNIQLHVRHLLRRAAAVAHQCPELIPIENSVPVAV